MEATPEPKSKKLQTETQESLPLFKTEEEQQALWVAIRSYLKDNFWDEVEGKVSTFYRTQLVITTKVLRKTASILTKRLHKNLLTDEAILLGLSDLVSPLELKNKAETEITNRSSPTEVRVIQTAKYLLEEKEQESKAKTKPWLFRKRRRVRGEK